MVAFLKTQKSITLQFKGMKPYIIQVDNPLATTVMDLIKNKATDQELINTVDRMINIKKHVSGLFDIDGELVYINGEKIPTSLSARLVDFADNGILNQAQALVNFWNNCKLNPDPVAKSDLYNFLNHNNIPVTEDGCFIAYKYVSKVGDKLMDSYTKTFVNDVGSIVKMNRTDCNADRNQTCSTGLHVATFEYANSGTEVIIEVKVNPKDVVSIPTDYNGQKMRVCEYEVVAINCDKTKNEVAKPIEEPIYTNDEYVEDDMVDELMRDAISSEDETVALVNNDGWKSQKRDSKGRFLPKS